MAKRLPMKWSKQTEEDLQPFAGIDVEQELVKQVNRELRNARIESATPENMMPIVREVYPTLHNRYYEPQEINEQPMPYIEAERRIEEEQRRLEEATRIPREFLQEANNAANEIMNAQNNVTNNMYLADMYLNANIQPIFQSAPITGNISGIGASTTSSILNSSAYTTASISYGEYVPIQRSYGITSSVGENEIIISTEPNKWFMKINKGKITFNVDGYPDMTADEQAKEFLKALSRMTHIEEGQFTFDF